MLNGLIRQLSAALNSSDSRNESATARDLQRVSTQLLVEVALADHHIDPAERDSMHRALCEAFHLDAAEIERIIDEAIRSADASTSLYDSVELVNEHFDKHAKLQLVEQMWRVAMADGDLDKYEEYTIRKLCDLLYVKHRDFIQAKLRVIA